MLRIKNALLSLRKEEKKDETKAVAFVSSFRTNAFGRFCGE